MPLAFQNWIHRSDLRRNRLKLYLFGDNEQRAGLGGQAKECRGEPNAVGVATKIAPAREPDSYWSDRDYDRCVAIVDRDLEPAFLHIRLGGTVICPSSGLGTYMAELPTRAPRLFQHVRTRIIELKRLGNEPQPSFWPWLEQFMEIAALRCEIPNDLRTVIQQLHELHACGSSHDTAMRALGLPPRRLARAS